VEREKNGTKGTKVEKLGLEQNRVPDVQEKK
jgi:hypothetical protein